MAEVPVVEECIRAFQDLWRFKVEDDSSTEQDTPFWTEAQTMTYHFESQEDHEGDLLQSYLTYLHGEPEDEQVAATMDRWKYLCFAAFRHGFVFRGEPVSFACEVTETALECLVLYDDGAYMSLPDWFYYSFWIILGSYYQKLAKLSSDGIIHVTRNKQFASRAMDIHEFEKGVLFESLSDTKPGETFLFLSHRWLTPEHPDPRGNERTQIKTLLDRTQGMLDFLVNPTSQPLEQLWVNHSTNPLENMYVPFVSSLEFSFALHFFSHQQKQVKVWYDYYSIPQGADSHSQRVRHRCLEEIDDICRTVPVLGVMPGRDYFRRGWCFFECLQCELSIYPTVKLRFWQGTGKPNNMFSSENVEDTLYTKERIQIIHGQFCQKLEAGMNPLEAFHDLGIQCTNGTDLQFLANQLERLSKGQDSYYLPEKQSFYLVHPLLTAYRLVLHQAFPANLAIEDAGHHWANFIRMVGSWIATLYTAQTKTPAGLFRCGWRHPRSALGYMIEMQQEWEFAPNFAKDVARFQQKLEKVVEAAAKSDNKRPMAEQCPELVTEVAQSLDEPHWVAVVFAGLGC
ncbi:expressed unknown protein [Seminavis robusta]|uniref:Uncharacterized protein n=1 Tax=Seminavis robusta TaxID=568900 RepID=A0A9N8DVL8_9STRA|nr:expressed unknown protein [Seminavis robusta]|eukprot:Sro385_g131730.1 n/a (569) ;mRNA; f:52465-54171